MIRPSPFIEQFERQLGYQPKRILDIGCHLGRNSLYLARLGHDVISVDPSAETLGTAKSLAANHDILNCQFVVADGRKLPFGQEAFSAVLINEMLHMMPKAEAKGVLSMARHVTKNDGLHAVSGYFIGEGDLNNDKGQFFSTNELAEEYLDAGWHILSYHEDKPRIEEIDDKFYVHSLATLIARKPYR